MFLHRTISPQTTSKYEINVILSLSDYSVSAHLLLLTPTQPKIPIMPKKTITSPEIRLVSRAKICAITGISPSGIRTGLMPRLTKGLHYFEIPGGKKFLYNEMLILDFLVNGNSEAHQRACHAFILSLPSSQAA